MDSRFLFRGKQKNTGEWITGCYFEEGGDCYIKCKGSGVNLGTEYSVIPETVCQCTGLRDKNETLIFEGDILYDENYKTDVMFTVDWNKDKCRFVTHCKSISKSYENNLQGIGGVTHLLEVVGNIHNEDNLTNFYNNMREFISVQNCLAIHEMLRKDRKQKECEIYNQ